MDRPRLAALGAVGAAIASILCCAGPLVMVALGLSGAWLASTFEPLRPYFLGGTAVLLGSGFYLLHREEAEACEPGKACVDFFISPGTAPPRFRMTSRSVRPMAALAR